MKKINELSLDEFFRRLIFGTEAADISSAQQLILRVFQGKSLSFETTTKWKPYVCRHCRSRVTDCHPKEHHSTAGKTVESESPIRSYVPR